MEFLVRITTELPAAMPTAEREELLAREAARGRELVAAGVLTRVWRLPGELANVGVWRVPGPDELHEALVSLPVWRHARVSVTPLARHPLDGA